MAIDTRDKRASALAAGLLALRIMPTADADAETAADRRHLLAGYAGVTASGGGPGTPGDPPPGPRASLVTSIIRGLR